MPKLFFRNLILVALLFSVFACKNNSTTKENSDENFTSIIAPELAELNENINKNPENASLYHQRAKYYMNSQDYKAALADMSNVMKLDSAKPEFYITLSDIYFTTNQSGKSKEMLEKCISLDSKNTEAMLKLAELYFFVKMHQESINYINEALRIDKYLSKGYFLKGMNYIELGDTTKAISAMATATEQNQEYTEAYMELGVLHAAKKNRLAIDYYNNVLRIEPTNTQALYNIAKFYQDINEQEKAVESYLVLLKIDPKYKDAHYNLGAIAFNNKEYATGIKHFSNAINADAKYANAYFARATCYELIKEREKAKNDFEMTLQLNPNHQAAKEILIPLPKIK